MFKRLNITTQLVIMVLAIAAASAAFVSHLLGTARENAALVRAVAVADIVQGVGDWVAQHGGIWVRAGAVARVGAYEEKEAVASRVVASEPGEASPVADPLLLGPAFHSKSASLVQSEMARSLKIGGGVQAKLTSDSHLNPINAPSAFEAEAIKRLREDQQATEYTEVRNGSVHYVRKIVADQTCLACHGDPSTAPQQLRTVFGITNGYGYKVGEMAGVISVTSPIATVVSDVPIWRDTVSMALIAVLLVVLIAAALGLRAAVVRPIRQLQTFARAAASASLDQKVAVPEIGEGDASSSHNEIHGLGASLKAMYQSMRILHRDSTAANAENVKPL